MAIVKYRYGVPEKSSGPTTGISESSGILIRSIVGGVFSHVFLPRIRRNTKLVMPIAPMFTTTPAMIWSTLCRMPSQASRNPTPIPASIAVRTPAQTPARPLPVIVVTRLAEMAAAHALRRNLPSMAMLSMPLRSDRMPAKAPRETGIAYSSVPAKTFVMFAVLPSSRAATIAAM